MADPVAVAATLLRLAILLAAEADTEEMAADAEEDAIDLTVVEELLDEETEEELLFETALVWSD